MDAVSRVRPALAPEGRSPLGPSISAVVPAYNEAANLPRLLPLLCDELRRQADRWEIVVVDDGSRDDTLGALAPWLSEGGVRLVRLSRNFGKEAALSAGIELARGDVVVLLDADLQHPPSLIGPMLQRWAEGADTVCALRESRADESWLKRAGARWFYRIVNAGSSVEIREDAGDFRLMDRRVVDALRHLPERNRFLKGLYAWVGFRTVYLPYTPEARASGHSTFSLRSLRKLAITGITAFSTLPLRLWSGVGALIALAALVYGFWIVVDHWLEGHPLPGWPTLAAGLMFFSGIQLLSIGILGEYIGRIFEEVKHRPIYLVDEVLGESRIPEPGA